MFKNHSHVDLGIIVVLTHDPKGVQEGLVLANLEARSQVKVTSFHALPNMNEVSCGLPYRCSQLMNSMPDILF